MLYKQAISLIFTLLRDPIFQKKFLNRILVSVGNESQSLNYSLKEAKSPLNNAFDGLGNTVDFLQHFQVCTGSRLFLYASPHPQIHSICPNPCVDILDLETNWSALTWQPLILWLSPRHCLPSLPHMKFS